MESLVEEFLLEKVYEVYSPYTMNSTGIYYSNLKDIPLIEYCDETDKEFENTPYNIKVKYKVKKI